MWCQFIKKPKPIATYTRDLSKLHGIATNLDLLIALLQPALIGRSNYFGISFTTFN